MISITAAILKTAGILILAASPRIPVAVVEDITGNPPGIQFMDYVAAGQVIKLGPHDTIVLGYLKSCWRETITGGTVTVGKEQSKVESGHSERSRVACEGGKMLLSGELARDSSAMVFRAPPNGRKVAPHPQFTLFGLSPIIELRPGSTLVIERVDKPGEQHQVAVSDAQLTHGSFFDLAKAGIVLAAGGVYRVKAGARELVFKIDRNARRGNTPIVGRLIRFQSGN